MSDALEWQAAEGSDTLHVIDTERAAGRRSGPRALCGKYPRPYRDWWFALPLAELPDPPPYGLTRCESCTLLSAVPTIASPS